MHFRLHSLTYILLLLALLMLLSWVSLPFSPSASAATFPFIGILHAGNRPEALAVNTQTHMLYIGYESGGLVVGFDPLGSQVRWRTHLGDVATDVQVDSSSNRVFVTSTAYQQQQSSLAVLDGTTGRVLFTTPVGAGDNGIALDPQRQLVYVTCANAGVVDVFTFKTGWQGETITNVQMTHFSVGPHPDGVVVNSRLGRVYVADMAFNVVVVLDEATGKELATIVVGSAPLQPMRVDEATGRVYVVCSTSEELDVIDGKRNAVIARIPVGPYPEGLAIQSATGRIYVADEGSKELGGGPQDSGTTITAIDGQTLSLLGTLQVGQAPDGVAVDAELHRVYVAVEEGNAVVEMSDSPNMPLVATATTNQIFAARRAIGLLQQAAILTLVLMILTFSGATLLALLPRWRARGSPQTPPVGASSRSEEHSLPQ
jgi:YVTN family beta-propeller protein